MHQMEKTLTSFSLSLSPHTLPYAKTPFVLGTSAVPSVLTAVLSATPSALNALSALW